MRLETPGGVGYRGKGLSRLGCARAWAMLRQLSSSLAPRKSDFPPHSEEGSVGVNDEGSRIRYLKPYLGRSRSLMICVGALSSTRSSQK